MSRLKELTDYRNTVLNRLTSNQNVCKAVYYNELDFLSKDDVEPEDVMYRNIFPYYYIPGVDSKMKTYINVSLTDFRKAGSVHFKAGILRIHVITHKDLFRTDYGCLRTDYLIAEINDMFDGVRGIGLHSLEYLGMKEEIVNANFLGNYLEYRPVD